MRHHLAALIALLLLGGCAAQSDDIRNRPLGPNPSAFVAAELGFARLAQDKGQWTAFRETSAPDAVMFVPERVKARDWLRKQSDPAEAVKWQPHAVYVSCDGNVGATTGAWQKGPTSGYFTTIWLRDPKSGKMMWALDHGDTLATAREEPDFIETKLADCSLRAAAATAADAEGADREVGLSPDRSLSWTSVVHSDGARNIVVRLWDGTTMQPVIDDRVAAPVR